MSGIAVFITIPRLWNKIELVTKTHQMALLVTHAGVALYAIALWVAGIGEGYMWLTQSEGGELVYSFVEAMDFKAPWLFLRFFGEPFCSWLV